MPNIYIGENLRYFRQKAGYTPRQLGTKSGVATSKIYAVEAGIRAGFSIDNLVRLSDVLGISIDMLIRGENHDM